MLEKYSLEMLEVRKMINDSITCADDEISKIITDYFSNGGKRVRPLLTLVCGRLGNSNAEVKKIASIIEIIHTTTLIHDDIIDGAKERRGNLTLNNIYTNNKALFIGDFLFARVLTEVSKIENELLHKYLSMTLKELCLGEIIQHNDLYNTKSRVVDYLKKIKRKTAILIAFSCLAGAICSKANEKEIIACYKFGYYLGMSYQIMDDYLDFYANKEQLGKDVGQDLLNGNITLPTILKIKKDNLVFENFKNISLEEKQKLINDIKNDKEVLEETLNLSEKYLAKARTSIAEINNEVKTDLIYILEKLSTRKY